MSMLRSIASILLVIGIIGLVVPGIPGREFIWWAIVLAVIVFVADLVTGRKVG